MIGKNNCSDCGTPSGCSKHCMVCGESFNGMTHAAHYLHKHPHLLKGGNETKGPLCVNCGYRYYEHKFIQDLGRRCVARKSTFYPYIMPEIERTTAKLSNALLSKDDLYVDKLTVRVIFDEMLHYIEQSGFAVDEMLCYKIKEWMKRLKL